MNPATQPNFYSGFRQAVSPERLSTYRSPGETDEAIICRYLWSIALNESLYQPLQFIEIVFRNTLYETIAGRIGSRAWLTARSSILKPSEQAALNVAIAELQRDRIPVFHSTLIPRLSFGFWTSLLNTRYDTVLWPGLLRVAFPHLPRRTRTRNAVSARFNRIRHLRNRVFHHEPVWHWADLVNQHTDLLEAIGWMSRDAKAIAVQFDRFESVHRSGPSAFMSGVASLCKPGAWHVGEDQR